MNVLATAKINLGLRILSKRADGFHELETIFAELDGLMDELEFEIRKDGNIHLETAEQKIPKEENLVFCAAQLLQSRFAVQKGISIRLNKKIPIGAGLGGGSSDAAATLKALNELWQLDLKLAELEKLAAELGSDCPFFVRGGMQKGTGRGEILRSFELPIGFPRQVVLFTPNVHISTAKAFTAFDTNTPQSSFEGNKGLDIDLKNDFESVIFARHPELAETKKWLLASGAELASLSGSGSTVFGLFYERPDIELPGILHAKIKA